MAADFAGTARALNTTIRGKLQSNVRFRNKSRFECIRKGEMRQSCRNCQGLLIILQIAVTEKLAFFAERYYREIIVNGEGFNIDDWETSKKSQY